MLWYVMVLTDRKVSYIWQYFSHVFAADSLGLPTKTQTGQQNNLELGVEP